MFDSRPPQVQESARARVFAVISAGSVRMLITSSARPPVGWKIVPLASSQKPSSECLDLPSEITDSCR